MCVVVCGCMAVCGAESQTSNFVFTLIIFMLGNQNAQHIVFVNVILSH